MNIAIIGNNCLADTLSQRFHQENNVKKIYTYDLPEKSFKSDKIQNSQISVYDPDFQTIKDFWMKKLHQIQNYKLDLIIATNLFPQLWKTFFNKLEETGIPLFIPNPEIAWLEWSKTKSKRLFVDLKIPTSDFEILSYQEIFKNFKKFSRPYVLKYDQDYREGLQTIIINNENVDEEYENFKRHGHLKIKKELSVDDNILFVKEKFIKGKEYSYHVICNGKDCRFIGAARDYKKRFENDLGFNTGGMGAYSPVSYINHSVLDYAKKILNYFINIGIEYKGIMYLGIIVDENENHRLLEVNTRFGDPEFISILPTIKNNLSEVFLEASLGNSIPKIYFNEKKIVSLRLVTEKYDLNSKVNLTVLDFKNKHDNISISYGKGYNNLGPVLTTDKNTLKDSAIHLQEFLENKNLGDYVYRKDIGLYL